MTKSLADLELDAAKVGGGAARTKVAGTEKPPARGATTVVRGTPEEGAKAIADMLEFAEAHLMAGPAARSGSLPRSARMARLRRARRRSRRWLGALADAAKTTAAGIVVSADPKAAAAELAGYVARVVAVTAPDAEGHAWAQIAAQQERRFSASNCRARC